MGGGIMKSLTITVNAAQRLYWKGRYLQRTQTMLKELLVGYDNVIDRDFDNGRHHYEKLGVTIDYVNAHDFLRQAVYGNHPSSIASMIVMARENAIETRNLLDERGFARLNVIHNRILSQCGKVVTPQMLEEFIDDIAFILGIFSSELGRPAAYNFIRLGQQIERFDLILRLYEDFDLLSAEIESVNVIARRLNRHYRPLAITTSDLDKALSAINDVINRVIQADGCKLDFTVPVREA